MPSALGSCHQRLREVHDLRPSTSPPTFLSIRLLLGDLLGLDGDRGLASLEERIEEVVILSRCLYLYAAYMHVRIHVM